MIDVATIKIKAGNGGDGKVSFRREKYITKGGPDGGDGGNGGSVYIAANSNMATLMDFHSKTFYRADDGEAGGKKQMTGATGSDLTIKVPVGTLIYHLIDGREVLVGDMSDSNKVFKIAKGGIGGKGNLRFKSSTNRTPLQYTIGTKGEDKEIKLEIKMMADIGLIGLPNAGKSTLINSLTNANARVADYPFTTLSPNLGVLRLKTGQDLIIADIPGLIEGASKGKGLGDEFLRHVERTRLLVHLVDPLDFSQTGVLGEDSKESISERLVKNARENYRIVRNELNDYGAGLTSKREIAVISKLDITEIHENFDKLKQAFKEDFKINIQGISGVTGEGLDELKNTIIEMIRDLPERVTFSTEKITKIYTIESLPNRKIVFGSSLVREKEMP